MPMTAQARKVIAMPRLAAARTVDTSLLKRMAAATPEEALEALETSRDGLTEAEAAERLHRYGRNQIAREKPPAWYVHLAQAFSNPFSAIIRTRKIPFIQSTAAPPVILATTTAIAAACTIPFTPLGAHVGMQPLPLSYWPWLAGIIVLYMIQTQLVKVFYMKRFNGEWL